MKLILAQRADIANPLSLIKQQRRANLQALSDLNRLSLQQNGNQDVVTNLLIEGAALHLEADLKWLVTIVVCVYKVAKNTYRQTNSLKEQENDKVNA